MGTLWIMWPFQERTYEIVRGQARLIQSVPIWPAEFDMTVLMTTAWMVMGFATVLWISSFARNRLRIDTRDRAI